MEGVKKKKVDKMVMPGTGEVIKKKAKNPVQKDEVGNIIYPIVISSSLKLVAPGSKVHFDRS